MRSNYTHTYNNKGLQVILMCCCIVLFCQNLVAQSPNSNAQAPWKLNGSNADSSKFVGTTNNVDLIFKRNNIEGFRLLQDTATKFLGEVYLDKFKDVPPINSGPPKEVFLKVDNFGKITSTDKSGLLNSIYTSGPCLASAGGNLPIWTSIDNGTYGILYTGGINCPARVGIGTNNPNSALTVVGSGFFSSELSVNVLPNIKYQLDIESTIVKLAGIHLFNNHPTPIPITSEIYGIQNVVNNNDIIAYSVTNNLTNQDVFRVMGDGRVGIGTDAVNDFFNAVNGEKFMLTVEGAIRTREINVDATSIVWSDYILAKDYPLSSLQVVENYITKHHHLPNVPSEKEVKEKGINLGEMDAILLRKIEELTLYVIEQQKKIEELQNQLKGN